ncbi:MAG: hypothetical protein P8L99_05010 [Hyphomicrobiales bacterium]|nr:hypothetical protein [Hyphomicrobiales bacterium]
MRRLFAFATVLLLAAPAWADFDDGMAAYERGEYETAFEEGLPFAEQGDAEAQFGLALMYEFGDGVPQDYAEAVKWYSLSAVLGAEIASSELNNG